VGVIVTGTPFIGAFELQLTVGQSLYKSAHDRARYSERKDQIKLSKLKLKDLDFIEINFILMQL
jgi:hypothetical protein